MIKNPVSGFDPIQLNGQLRYPGGFSLFDDFFYGNAGNAWFTQSWVVQGTGNVDFNSANVADRPGVISLNSGVANSFTLLSARQVVQPLPNGFWRFQAAVMVPVLSNGVDRFFARPGVLDSNTNAANPVDGMFFEYSDVTNGGNWTGVTTSGGVSSSVNSGIPVVAGTFYNLTVQGADASAPVLFSINGVQIGSLTTNVTAANLLIGFQMAKTLHTTPSTLRADLVYFGYAFSAFR